GTEPGPTGQHPDRARGALPVFPARPAGGGFRLARAPVPGAPVPVAGALAARAAFARGFFAPAVAHGFFGLAVPGGFFAPAFDDGFFMRGPGRFARDRPVAAFDVPRFFGTGARAGAGFLVRALGVCRALRGRGALAGRGGGTGTRGSARSG